jgi:hypothetical protein
MMAPAASPPITAATPQPRQYASAGVGANVPAASSALAAIARTVFLMVVSWAAAGRLGRTRMSLCVSDNGHPHLLISV